MIKYIVYYVLTTISIYIFPKYQDFEVDKWRRQVYNKHEIYVDTLNETFNNYQDAKKFYDLTVKQINIEKNPKYMPKTDKNLDTCWMIKEFIQNINITDSTKQ